jgi:hypothetical protein
MEYSMSLFVHGGRIKSTFSEAYHQPGHGFFELLNVPVTGAIRVGQRARHGTGKRQKTTISLSGSRDFMVHAPCPERWSQDIVIQ